MKKIINLCLFILLVHSTYAQIVYKDSLFGNISKSTHTYDSINKQTLEFDYYVAPEAQNKKPLVIYVHGGGFSGGARDDQGVVNFCNKLANYGYGVASVSYRLTMKEIGFGCDVPASKKIAAIDSASQDINRALKYILERNELFNIDKSKVVISGTSAGAETVLNMAYVYKHSTLPLGFRYAGVISMAGATVTLDGINFENAIPTQMFHGTGDRLVPYGIAAHHYCKLDEKGFLMLYGSQAIAKRLHGLGTAYYLYSVEGGAHEWSWLPMEEAFDEIVDFLYNDIVEVKNIRQTTRSIGVLD